MDSSYWKAYYQLGKWAAISGQNLARGQEALQAFLAAKGAVASPRTLAWTHYRLGMIAEKRGDLPAARRHYQTALQHDPKHKEAKKAWKRVK